MIQLLIVKISAAHSRKFKVQRSGCIVEFTSIKLECIQMMHGISIVEELKTEMLDGLGMLYLISCMIACYVLGEIIFGEVLHS